MKLDSLLRGVFTGHFAIQREPMRKSPMDLFMRRHSGHPLVKDLRHALLTEDDAWMETIENKIQVCGWRAFLASMSRSNARALYSCLAKAEGRGK